MSSLVNAALNQAGIVRPTNAAPGERGVVGTVVGTGGRVNANAGGSSRMEIEGAADGRMRRGGGRGGGGSGRARKGGRNGGDHQSGSRYTPLASHTRHDPLSTSGRTRRPPPPGKDAPGAVAVDAAKSADAAQQAAAKGGSHVRTIKEWLATRVRGPGILDLHSMVSDSLLTGPGIKMPGHPDARAIHGEVFWKCIAEQDPHTHTLRLSHNNFRDLKILATLPKWLPHVRALDLSDNEDLHKIGMLDVLSTQSCLSTARDSPNRLGLYNLRELKLTNTKMRRDAESQNRMTTYLRDIMARFPNLTMLDEELVPRITFPVGVDYPIKAIEAREMQEIQEQAFRWPYDVKGNLVETPALEAFATTFLAKFFAAFDSDRTVLIPVYAPQATLSYNLTTTIPRRKAPSTAPPPAGKNIFDTWSEHNRNLVRIGKHRRVNTLIVSDESRLREWLDKTVPRTEHPLNDPAKWMYDVLPLDAVAGVGRIMLTIHGEFMEAEAQAGTPAAAAGWPSLILSDTISLRSLCDISNFTKSLAVAGAQIVPRHVGPPPAGVSAEIASIPGLTPEQMLVVTQVQNSTNLVTSMALDCARTAGFNLEVAMTKFHELQAQIPAEFFRHIQ
ncbi:hypothetical protein QFC19_007314 [Naganishia cerealis]|uniref:Uncharacterized protein n=1 Tax=Naganishia cerealis TaxID=610337 RepID=A0ACC2VAD9_9TREE|nr:hypothetical protein QFC19_007314 [Naganishia cerealis]